LDGVQKKDTTINPNIKNNGAGVVDIEMHIYLRRLVWPYAQVKLHKLEQIIDHYAPEETQI
jgi:hypothetical protein